MSLPRLMIRILPQNDRLDLIIGRILQRIKNIVHSRIDRPGPVLLNQKRSQFLIVFLFKFSFENLIPHISYIHHIAIIHQPSVNLNESFVTPPIPAS